MASIYKSSSNNINSYSKSILREIKNTYLFLTKQIILFPKSFISIKEPYPTSLNLKYYPKYIIRNIL